MTGVQTCALPIYLGGDDIRNDCKPGGMDRYRLVYNGVWEEQVRAYDLTRSATGEGGLLLTTIFAGGGLDLLGAVNPFSGPWGGIRADRRLDEAEYRGIVAAVERSGFGEPPPDGLRLYSQRFYWVLSGCVNGRFHFDAWTYPGSRFDATIAFAGPLFAADNSGVRVNRPREVDPGRNTLPGYDTVDTNFTLVVGPNGLR